MKPEAKPTKIVCSVCGLDWERHGKKEPTLEKCVELLKTELATKPAMSYVYPGTASPLYWK